MSSAYPDRKKNNWYENDARQMKTVMKRMLMKRSAGGRRVCGKGDGEVKCTKRERRDDDDGNMTRCVKLRC